VLLKYIVVEVLVRLRPFVIVLTRTHNCLIHLMISAQCDGVVVSQVVVVLVVPRENLAQSGIMGQVNRMVHSHLLRLVAPVYKAYLKLVARAL